MGDASNLPKDVIHHIFNYCSMKEEAFSSMICKNWYNAYSTRPLLNFNETEIRAKSHRLFFEFVSNTFKKREAEMTPIDEVSIRIFDNVDMSSYLHQWFEGVVRCSTRSLKFRCNDVTVPQSIYEAKSLVEFTLSDCKLEYPIQRNIPIFQNLKRLSMCMLKFSDDRLLDKILSSCSLLEDLKIALCGPIQEITLGQNLQKLEKVYIVTMEKNVSFDLHVHNIVNLSLDGVILAVRMLNNFATLFPRLVNLEMRGVSSLHQRVSFSSQSVKSLVLGDSHGEKVDLDLPHLLYFTHSGKDIPSLLLTTAPTELSYKTIIRCQDKVATKLKIRCRGTLIDFSWFIRLRDLLTQSPISSISLTLALMVDTVVTKVRGFGPGPLLEIDQLEFDQITRPPLAYTGLLLDGILRFFRPSTIFIPDGNLRDSGLQQVKSMWEILMEKRSLGPCGLSHYIYDVEIMGSHSLGERLQKTSIGAIKYDGLFGFGCVRFILKWHQDDSFSRN